MFNVNYFANTDAFQLRMRLCLDKGIIKLKKHLSIIAFKLSSVIA